MAQEKKIEFLVVDTGGFIKNAALQDIGKQIYTEENVVNEITSKRQLKQLVVLPYDLIVKQAYKEDITIVTDFAKKTGDLTSLSPTDIKVIALTYRLHIENIGKDTLKQNPKTPKIADLETEKQKHPPNLAGFYQPDKEKTNINEEDKSSKEDKEILEENFNKLNIDDNEEKDCSSNNENNESACKNNCEIDYNNKDVNHDYVVDENYDNYAEDDEDDNYDEDEEDDDDDDGWITKSNIKQVTNDMGADVVEDVVAKVACLTMDFAMQNVMKQMGLNVVTLEGKLIKQLRTFIFRCYACFKTTSNMTKRFCPHCGLQTLKKVSVALNENGELQMFINFNKPLSARGKRFSLPTPKGGKHSNYPILREDQRMPDQRISKLARQKNNPLNDDWIAGYSPFVTRDVYSKSATLGIRPGSQVKHWMRINPNEAKRGKKKEKII